MKTFQQCIILQCQSMQVQIKIASPCSLLESLLKGNLNQMKFVEYTCQFLNYSYCKIFTTSLLQGPSGPLAKSTQNTTFLIRDITDNWNGITKLNLHRFSPWRQHNSISICTYIKAEPYVLDLNILYTYKKKYKACVVVKVMMLPG